VKLATCACRIRPMAWAVRAASRCQGETVGPRRARIANTVEAVRISGVGTTYIARVRRNVFFFFF